MENQMAGLWKPRLLDLAAQGAADLHTFVAGLSAAERDATGSADHWSAKDHVAHLMVWQGQSARLLGAAGRGETPDPVPDEEAFNTQMAAAWRDRSWAAVLAEGAAVDARLRAAITACAEDAFAPADRFPWRAGRPLWTLVYGNGYSHPLEHYVHNSIWKPAGRTAPWRCNRGPSRCCTTCSATRNPTATRSTT